MDSAALSWYLRSLCIAVDFHFCAHALPKNGDFPCRGVWCLFEFFLPSCQHLDLVFVTNAGVVGDAAWRKWFVLKSLEPGNHLLFLWKKTVLDCHCKCRGQVIGSARARVFISSARQSKQVGTRHFRIQVNLCKQEAGPDGLQKNKKADGQYIL